MQCMTPGSAPTAAKGEAADVMMEQAAADTPVCPAGVIAKPWPSIHVLRLQVLQFE